jgi:hypothetical protein
MVDYLAVIDALEGLPVTFQPEEELTLICA